MALAFAIFISMSLRVTTHASQRRAVGQRCFTRPWALRSSALGLLVMLALAKPGVEGPSARAPGQPSNRLSPIAEALAAYRLVEPRLTGGFSHAACEKTPDEDGLREPKCSSLRGRVTPELPALRRTRRIILLASAGAPAAERLHVEAVWHLLTDKRVRSLDAAVRMLERASRLAADDSAIASDLAAAYIVRAQRQNDARSLLAAVASSEEAVRLDPTCAEARFNLALALEHLNLTVQARSAWSNYLAHTEAASPWAAEARARRAALVHRPVGTRWSLARKAFAAEPLALSIQDVRRAINGLAQPTRQYLENEVLPEWAGAAASEPERASEAIRRAILIARALAAETDDLLILESITRAAESASEAPSVGRHLIRGHLLYEKGRRLYEQQDHDQARPLLENARAELAAAASPFALWAEYYAAVCDYHQPDYAAALHRLTSLLAHLGDAPYTSLRAHTEWMAGLTLLDQARYAEAVLAFQRALTGFISAREPENAAAMHNLLSRGFEAMGDEAGAWRHRHAALRGLSQVVKDRRISNILSSAVDGAVDAGFLTVADRFQREMVRQARASGNALLTAIALHKAASLAARLGRHTQAKRRIAEARTWCARVAGSGVRDRVTADALLAEGEVLRGSAPLAALAALENSVTLFREQGARVRLVAAERQRARTLEAAGDPLAAVDAYRLAIAEAEAQLSSVSQTELLAYSVETRQLYDDFLSLAARHLPPEEVFVWSEKARASYLRAGLRHLVLNEKSSAVELVPALSRELSLDSLSAQLAAGIVLVEYKLIQDRLLRWTITSEGVRFRQTRLDRRVLAESVAMLRRMIRTGASLAALRDDLANLGRLTLGQMQEELEDARCLVIVPDGPLAGLPFDLLFLPGDVWPLIRRLPVVSLPSAHLLTASIARAEELAQSPPQTALAIGNPTFDRRLFESLDELPDAAVEARRVARLYPRGAVLIGSAATRNALRRLGPASEVIHIASHVVLNPRDAWRASVLLATDPSTDDHGVLSTADLAHLRLPRTRLVVLAGCETAGGDTAVSDSVPTLLLPLLAAGVPTLVATLWEVDDAASLPLLESLHRRVAAGESPAAALRQAKLSLLDAAAVSPPSPAAWAPFVVVGGDLSATQFNVPNVNGGNHK